MTAALAHRGPDDAGFWFDGAIGMGFRRLAVIDTSPGGHQPMVSADGEHVLVFNGEIYNYLELRDELRAHGHRFQSASDSEVLLAAWRQWGEGAVDRLIGMFAFAIWDRRRGEIVGARDRLGIKPLFIYRGSDVVILTSEIKAIHASGMCSRAENQQSVARYLVNGQLDDGTSTCFAEIEQIGAAHLFRIGADGNVRQRRYYEWPSVVRERADDAPAVVRELLEESIRLRTRSDVPVGVCLSGGLDSTAILCAIARQRRDTGDDAPLLAFSFNSQEFDESPYIDATLRDTGATLVPMTRSAGALWSTLQRVLHFHDEPLHSMNALVGFDLMRLARQHGALVILNGQGADETLGGYSSYYLAHWTTLVLEGRLREAMREIDAYARAFHASTRELAGQVLRTMLFRALRHVPGYGSLSRRGRAAELRGSEWFTHELTSNVPDRREPIESRLDRVQRQSVTKASLPLYLRIEDRNSMAHGVEVRVPFLDHRLVSYGLMLPMEWRMRGPLNKYALREALRGRIPEVVRARVDKMGFPTPTAKWFGGELYEPLHDLLDSAATRDRGLYQTTNLLRALRTGRGGMVADHDVLFRVANVETWLTMLADRARESAADSQIPIAITSEILVDRPVASPAATRYEHPRGTSFPSLPTAGERPAPAAVRRIPLDSL